MTDIPPRDAMARALQQVPWDRYDDQDLFDMNRHLAAELADHVIAALARIDAEMGA